MHDTPIRRGGDATTASSKPHAHRGALPARRSPLSLRAMGDRWNWWPLLLLAAACSEQARSSAADQLEATAETSREAEANDQPLPRAAPPEQVLPLAQKRYAAG